MYSTIDKDIAIKLLKEVGAELSKSGLNATMDVHGGIAMALTITPLYSSADIDMRISQVTYSKFKSITDVVGKRYGLANDWLNSDVVPIIDSCMKKETITDYEVYDGLTVRLPAAEQLLAMKVFSARLGDDEHDFYHAIALCKELKISEWFEIEAVLKKFVREDAINEQNRTKGRHRCVHNFIDELVKELKS